MIVIYPFAVYLSSCMYVGVSDNMNYNFFDKKEEKDIFGGQMNYFV